MRLKDYMRLSSPDEDSSTFRSLKIGLTKEDKKYADIVNRLSTKYDYLAETIDLIDEMNKLFRSLCKGMYKFKYRLCIDEDVHPSSLHIPSTKRKQLLLKGHEINDSFTRIKNKFEEDLKQD